MKGHCWSQSNSEKILCTTLLVVDKNAQVIHNNTSTHFRLTQITTSLYVVLVDCNAYPIVPWSLDIQVKLLVQMVCNSLRVTFSGFKNTTEIQVVILL